MNDQIIVADLLKHDNRRASIRFLGLEVCSTLHDYGDDAFVGFYKIGNDRVEAGHGTHSYEKHCKAMSKCRHSAAILTRIPQFETTGQRPWRRYNLGRSKTSFRDCW